MMNREYRYFSYEQDTRLACRCCGVRGVDPDFLYLLDSLRDVLGFPLVVSSGYRCPQYNLKVSPQTGEGGPHTTGLAVDIFVHGERAHRLVGGAMLLGFTGIGVKQSGHHSRRFIHLDTIPGQGRPWIWSY